MDNDSGGCHSNPSVTEERAGALIILVIIANCKEGLLLHLHHGWKRMS